MINFELVMVKLSVNINKIATIRNARGGNTPDLLKCAKDIESFGAQGITVHPRPDERHIRYEDVYELSKILKTEFNIEGNPNKKFIDLVLNVKPAQVTLVPDDDDAITSNSGWNTKKNQNFLKEINSEFTASGIRTSIFVDPINEMVEYAKLSGADRIELYTENYANGYNKDKKMACRGIRGAITIKENDGDLPVSTKSVGTGFDSSGNEIDDISNIDKFDIATSAVLYNSWTTPELRERMSKLIAEIEEGKWFVSMECLFNNFDYAVGKQWKDEFLDNFGYGLANVIDILDPDVIILGGGLSNIDFLYTEGVESIYSKVFSDVIETPILKNKLGDSSGVFGAALLN